MNKSTTSNSYERNKTRRVVPLDPPTATKTDPIYLFLCRTPCDRSSAKRFIFDKRHTLQEVKETILNGQANVQSVDEFYLVYFDEKSGQWKQMDQSNLSKRLGELRLPNDMIISVKIDKDTKLRNEKSTKTKSQTQQKVEFNLRLCLIPKRQKETTLIKSYSSDTIGQLREQIYGKFHVSSKEKPLFIWNDGWILFDVTYDNHQLRDYLWLNHSYVSIDLGFDFGEVRTPPGLTGLRNSGNTCFINSVIQCFSHTPEFTRRVLALPKDINSPILGEYIRVMRKIWSGHSLELDILDLLCGIRESLPRYERRRQQDAQEFMNYLLHAMHDELTENDTLIKELFYGRIQSRVTCIRCKNVERNHDTISFLPVPLKDDGKLKTFMLIRSNGELSAHTFILDSTAVKFKDMISAFLQQTSIKLKLDQIEVIELENNVIIKQHTQRKYMDETKEENLVLREVPDTSSREQLIECVFWDRSAKKYFRPPVLIVCPSKDCLYEHIAFQIDDLRGHICSLANANDSDVCVSWTNRDDKEFELKTNPNDQTSLKNIKMIRIAMDTKFVDIYRQNYDVRNSIDDNSLVGVLEDFFTEIPLNGDYFCSKCKKMTEAKQVSRLCLPLPPVLIIQLKRFTYEADTNEKINAFIRFPLEELDLSNYIVDDNRSTSSTKYDLVAISNHTGSMNSGHYTTYAKYMTDQEWYLFDDNYVQKVSSANSVITKNAYVLIYVLRKDR